MNTILCRHKTSNIIKFVVGLSLLIVIAISYFSGSFTTALRWIGSVVTIVSGSFLYFFEMYGWRNKWLRIGHVLSAIPDLRGRWEGTLDRCDNVGPHFFAIEIQQRASSIQVSTFSNRSSSNSLTAEILCDSFETQFDLIYSWLGNAGPLGGENETKIFHGTTILKLKNSDARSLCGFYYTDRQPVQTRGVINVFWVGLELTGSKESIIDSLP